MFLSFLHLMMVNSVSVYAQEKGSAQELLKIADELYYSNADSSYKSCLLIDRNDLSQEDKATLSMLLANHSIVLTDYENAEVELQEAKSLFESMSNSKGVARVYSITSILAARLGEHVRSRSLVLKAYAVYLELGDISGQINSLINTSGSYLTIENTDSAYYYLKELDKLKGDISATSYYFYYQNWGRYYALANEYIISEDYFMKALDVSEEQEMVDSKATILMSLGKLYKDWSDFEKADKYANMSYAFSDAHGLIYEKKDALTVLVDVAEKQQDFLSAFKFQQELSELDQEILNIEKINNVKKVKMLLDLSEKEKIIAAKDVELANSELEATNARFANRIFMFSLAAVALILLIVVYAFVRTRKLNQIIGKQHQALEMKNHQLSEVLTDLEGSISYSKMIQDTLLPGENSWSKFFEEDFSIFLPRDKVSGDFYWNFEDEDYVYFCVADCTGHGVPGAMVSVVGMNALESAVAIERLSSPGKILDRLAEIVEKTFSNEEKSMKDGMDIAFCRMDKKTKELIYAGANNPLYLVNRKGLSVFKANKQPIGKYDGRVPFSEEVIQLNKGDAIYLFSDGYADQFGGPKGKKFMYKSLRLIIEENKSKSMTEQRDILLSSFNNWKEGYEQVDDVCFVGLRV